MEHFKAVLFCIIIRALPIFSTIDDGIKATRSINGDVFQLRQWCRIFVDEAFLASAREDLPKASQRLA